MGTKISNPTFQYWNLSSHE